MENPETKDPFKRQELELRIKEFELKKAELNRGRWTNPLVVAIFTASLAAIASTSVALLSSYYQLQTEREKKILEGEIETKKIEAERIMHVLKTTEPSQREGILKFMLDTYLITDPSIRSGIQIRLDLASMIDASNRTGGDSSKTDYLYEATFNPTFKRMLLRFLDKYSVPDWIHSTINTSNMVTNPSSIHKFRENTYIHYWSCKPHDCSDNYFEFVFKAGEDEFFFRYVSIGGMEIWLNKPRENDDASLIFRMKSSALR